MDPLSITAAAVSFVDIARRIKDSVEKVGQIRQSLQHLVEDIVVELAELQKLCQDESLNRFDPDSTCSLQTLHSELLNVLERCQKLVERRGANKGLSSVKYHLIAWLKNAEIEGHILRLRDRVSSVHRRFTMIASLRAERVDNKLLVATSEMRVTMNRMESLLSPLFISSHASGTYPASALDHTSPDDFDHLFLRRQVRRTVDLLSRIAATYTFTLEESRGPLSRSYGAWFMPSQASLMRMATIETLQLLELDPSDLALWEGAKHLMDLGSYLDDLGLEADAAAIFIGATNIYQILMQKNPSTYFPYVTWGLAKLSWIHYGTQEGLNVAKRAVDICREAAAMSLEDSSTELIWSLRVYVNHLASRDYFDEALTSAMEALTLQRKAPTAHQDSDCVSVSWEASGEEHVALSSARTFSRPYEAAIDDLFCLGTYSFILGSLGRWSEALIIDTEALHCVNAIVDCESWTEDLSSWLTMLHDDHQYIMSRICPPSSPLVASISDVADDDLDHEDSAGEGDSGTLSGVLMQT